MTLETILNSVRQELAPSDEVLKTARTRRDLVLASAQRFKGVRRVYNSGSIAHGTANSDTDADCGIVLDRRAYPRLGPDGAGQGPSIVEEVRAHIRRDLDSAAQGIHLRLTKRAIQVNFSDEVDGENPSVDLIVALERADAPGLWIPNLPADSWDASHPEKHTELFTSGSGTLRRVRARATRLAKGWNKQFSDPAFCSFNLEVFSWHAADESMSQGAALAALFSLGAQDLARRNTPDPAKVSKPIKVLIDRDQAVDRLQTAASRMEAALRALDDDQMLEALRALFPDFVQSDNQSASKAALASAMRRGNRDLGFGAGGLKVGGSGVPLKPTRAYGE